MGRHRDPPAVRLVARELGDNDICALHRRGNCFVSLCRSEGWGLGAFDAAAHGKPVVTTGYGGQLDYLAGSPYLVDYDLVPVHDPAGFPSYSPAQRWAEPDVDHGARLLREVMSNRREAETVAGSMGGQIRWRYRPTAIATAFRDAVDAHRTARGGSAASGFRP
jgi:glycosyltransferase involved in cell wall biosynthesis